MGTMLYEKRGTSILVMKLLFKRVIYLTNLNFDSSGYKPMLKEFNYKKSDLFLGL